MKQISLILCLLITPLVASAEPPLRREPLVIISSPKADPDAREVQLMSLAGISGTTEVKDQVTQIRKVEVALRWTDPKMRIFRYWDGAKWTGDGRSFLTLPTTLQGNTWSLAVPIPAGDNLADGKYEIRASAYDDLGRITSATQDFEINRAPRITVSYPTASSKVVFLDKAHPLQGTFKVSEGGAPVTAMAFLLQRRAFDGASWDGKAWTGDDPLGPFPPPSPLTIVKAAGPGKDGIWKGDKLLPPLKELRSGDYTLTVSISDASGKIRRQTSWFHIDRTPKIAILSPAPSPPASVLILTEFPAFDGTISQVPGGPALKEVKLFISRYVRGTGHEEWTGQEWIKGEKSAWWLETGVPVIFKASQHEGQSGKWKSQSNLPPLSTLSDGNYSAIAAITSESTPLHFAGRSFTIRRGPKVTVLLPLASPLVVAGSPPPALEGTVESGIQGAQIASGFVVLWRTSPNGMETWDGLSWVKRPANPTLAVLIEPQKTAASTRNWKYTGSLPPAETMTQGSYQIRAQMKDRDGCEGWAVGSFTVVPTSTQ